MTNLFPERIKQLRRQKGLTQKRVADSLGIGQTTIANYENGTRFPDLDKLSEIADLYEVTVDYLLGRSEEAHAVKEAREVPRGTTIDFKEYMKSLLSGDKRLIRSIIQQLLDQGTPSEVIYQEFITRAMRQTGLLWEKGDLPIWKEHFISEMVQENMAMIKYARVVTSESKRMILAIVPGAENHTIGIRMIADRLEADGYPVIFLGNNIPAENILQAIRENKPHALLMSVTMPQHIDSVNLIIDKIKQTFGTKAPTILIGGHAFEGMKNVETSTGADKYCKTYEDIGRNLKRI